jgi:predicted aspartyl protease
MIQGEFGDKGEIFLPIDLITGEGISLAVEAMLDTGFTEYIAINKQDLQDLNWSYFDQEELFTSRLSLVALICQ